tara:strand:+ start:28 stop:183 length:156 start_codon:yes stop_codon:yes gene_type:complete
MNWISQNPENPGFYIVETTSMMGNRRRFESFWNGKKWNFTNQVFKKYLKEN